jgi:hypothetical protein
MKYTQFKIAREQVRNLKIKTVKEYFQKFKDGLIPPGIPRNPNRDYIDFVSWPDFLGNDNIAAKDKKFYSYEECQDYLLNKNIDSKEKFENWRKLKENKLVPTRPDSTYKKDWKSWGEFLKTGRISDIEKHNLFLSYEDAKIFLKSYDFKTEEEFYKWTKSENRPHNIPASPRKTYGSNFISMGDFLSNGNYHFKEYFSYQECREFVQTLNFNSIKEFENWISINKSITKVPAHPMDIYSEFEGWPEFLGYRRRVSVGEKTISSILMTNNIQHKLQYTIQDCKDFSVLPFDIAIIKNDELFCLIEYHGIQHFFPVKFFGGEEALKQTQKRDQIKRNYCSKNNIPLLEITYKENLEEKLSIFLQTMNVELDLTLERLPALNKNFLTFEKAKEAIQNLQINTVIEFKNLKDKRPFGVPHSPNIIYRNSGWISWGDFLGTNRVQSQKIVFVSFEECRQWFIDNNIKSEIDWKKVRKTKPNNIPSNPEKTYKHNWKGWKDFLKIGEHNLHKTP